tara:strand:- start:383 stop:556 length:174 start_codon:yes stop_codon:yes gene_type:complete
MTIKYKKVNWKGNLDSIRMYDDADASVNCSIPIKPDNTDYQIYLEWVAAGNTADAAD